MLLQRLFQRDGCAPQDGLKALIGPPGYFLRN